MMRLNTSKPSCSTFSSTSLPRLFKWICTAAPGFPPTSMNHLLRSLVHAWHRSCPVIDVVISHFFPFSMWSFRCRRTSRIDNSWKLCDSHTGSTIDSPTPSKQWRSVKEMWIRWQVSGTSCHLPFFHTFHFFLIFFPNTYTSSFWSPVFSFCTVSWFPPSFYSCIRYLRPQQPIIFLFHRESWLCLPRSNVWYTAWPSAHTYSRHLI